MNSYRLISLAVLTALLAYTCLSAGCGGNSQPAFYAQNSADAADGGQAGDASGGEGWQAQRPAPPDTGSGHADGVIPAADIAAAQRELAKSAVPSGVDRTVWEELTAELARVLEIEQQSVAAASSRRDAADGGRMPPLLGVGATHGSPLRRQINFCAAA